MKLNWSELQKGDKLYLLVPVLNESSTCFIYKYQESNVINIKFDPKRKSVTIRFKYTHVNGKRIRVNYEICEANINDDYLIIGDHLPTFIDEIYGNMIVMHDNPEQLNIIYKAMIYSKIDKLQHKIDEYKNNLNYLENQKYINIV